MFESQHFFIICILFFLIKKNTIENPKYNFFSFLYEIRKKRRKEELFVSIRFRNFVQHSF